jgi:hypothetical protein
MRIPDMKLIKLSGREIAVIRAIDNQGSLGAELNEQTQIAPNDLTDILNGLCDAGYVEAYRPDAALPQMEPVKAAEVLVTRFEVNPSYAQELKRAIAHR